MGANRSSPDTWEAEALRRFGPIPPGGGENTRLIAGYHYAFVEGAKAAAARSSAGTEALLPCPFCGGNSIDPSFWASAQYSGPGCDDCGATAETPEKWNTRGVAQGWRDISTAPKDGTFFLTFTPGCVQDTMAWSDYGQAWMNGYDDKPQQPTHWMPLPAPPVSSTEDK